GLLPSPSLLDWARSGPLLGASADATTLLLDSSNADSALWPRLGAAAALLWTPHALLSPPDDPSSLQALASFRCHLIARGVQASPLLPGYCLQQGDVPASVAVHTTSWTILVDPSLFLLLLLVLSLLCYGSHRSWLWDREIECIIEDQQMPAAEAKQLRRGVSSRTAILLPIGGSLVLLLLFFMLDLLSYVFLGLIMVAALSSVTFVTQPLFELLCRRLRVPANPLPRPERCSWVADISSSFLASLLFAIVLVALWLVFREWITTDILAIYLAVTSIAVLRLSSLKVATILLSLFFLYDIFWVFLSSCLFGRNVMVTVAVSIPSVPILIAFPRFLDSHGLSMLGLGDIVLPGIFLSFLYRTDMRLSLGPFTRSGYFLYSLFGYVCGLEIAFAMLPAFQKAQPALLYLVPGVLIPAVSMAAHRRQLKDLWNGVFPADPDPLQSSLLDQVDQDQDHDQSSLLDRDSLQDHDQDAILEEHDSILQDPHPDQDGMILFDEQTSSPFQDFENLSVESCQRHPSGNGVEATRGDVP
ncbi:MAG: hypothetical protein Q8P67_00835, partial [archaeon]|nr:hypothetical protein [archaeon]